MDYDGVYNTVPSPHYAMSTILICNYTSTLIEYF